MKRKMPGTHPGATVGHRHALKYATIQRIMISQKISPIPMTTSPVRRALCTHNTFSTDYVPFALAKTTGDVLTW